MKEPNCEQKLFATWTIASAMIESVKECLDDTIFENSVIEGVPLSKAMKIAARVLRECEEGMQCAFRDSQKSQC